MQYQASEAYRQARQKTATPRELEAGVLLAAAANLQLVANRGRSTQNPKHCPVFSQAMTFNCKTWTILVTSAIRSNHRLPAAISQSIAELGLFIIERSARIMNDASGHEADEALPVLIEINRTVAAGLRG